MARSILESILDETEKDMVQQFIDHPYMANAVKKCLLAGIYYNGTLEAGKEAINPLYNWALSLTAEKGQFTNEQIGADIRATSEGLRALELAFNAMAIFRKEEVAPTPENPAV